MNFFVNDSDLMKSEFEKYLECTSENEKNYTGIESDEESGLLEEDMPYDVTDIRVEQKMITVFQIEYWIKSGLLKLQPEYQRNLVWDQSRKSALIESMMLRIPIPAFYLDETADGSKNVIDGMQRLSTIHEFLNDGFRLKKMQYLAGCDEFKDATGGGINDVRMGAQELCLRYLTLFFSYDWERQELFQYFGLLKTMDATVLVLNEMSEEQLGNLLHMFKSVMGRARYLLGELSFKKPGNNKVNASLFTAWAIVLTRLGKLKNYAWPEPKVVRSIYLNRLKEDEEFYHAITSSTGTKRNILISLQIIRNIMEEAG